MQALGLLVNVGTVVEAVKSNCVRRPKLRTLVRNAPILPSSSALHHAPFDLLPWEQMDRCSGTQIWRYYVTTF